MDQCQKHSMKGQCLLLIALIESRTSRGVSHLNRLNGNLPELPIEEYDADAVKLQCAVSDTNNHKLLTHRRDARAAAPPDES